MAMTSSKIGPALPPRRSVRFSLRTLLIAAPIAAILLVVITDSWTSYTTRLRARAIRANGLLSPHEKGQQLISLVEKRGRNQAAVELVLGTVDKAAVGHVSGALDVDGARTEHYVDFDICVYYDAYGVPDVELVDHRTRWGWRLRVPKPASVTVSQGANSVP